MSRLITPARLVVLGLACTTVAAQAHTGHGTSSLMEGLMHPVGADHLLAMVAVGIWSVAGLAAHKAWQGPAMFMLALVISALLGTMGLTLPYLEHAIVLSVVLFGAMLVLTRQAMPPALGLGLIAAAASLHGLAHGSEAPGANFAGYAAGFMLTTAALHLGGMGIGLAVRRLLAERRGLALSGLGTVLGGAGLYLFTQL
jgi:urease accessory protein